MGSIPCRDMTASSMPRRPSRPPCTTGCSVLTRPSMISGKPVRSDTSTAAMPACASSRRVPPVERISMPSADNARAKGTRPRLSETLSSARRGFTGGIRLRRGREYSRFSLLDQGITLELLAQSPPVDPQDAGRLALVSLRVLHHGLEQGLLHFPENELVKIPRTIPVQAGEITIESFFRMFAQGFFARGPKLPVSSGSFLDHFLKLPQKLMLVTRTSQSSKHHLEFRKPCPVPSMLYVAWCTAVRSPTEEAPCGRSNGVRPPERKSIPNHRYGPKVERDHIMAARVF